MNTLLTKLLSGAGIVSVIFVFGFYSGYKVKSNAINAYNAQEQVKLASLQARYDNVSALTSGDYLTAFQGVINESNPNFNNNNSKFNELWDFWFKHHQSHKMSDNQPTECLDAKTKTSITNGRLNTIQLLFLQSYIKQIQELQ